MKNTILKYIHLAENPNCPFKINAIYFGYNTIRTFKSELCISDNIIIEGSGRETFNSIPIYIVDAHEHFNLGFE